jgi:hypothetical protein
MGWDGIRGCIRSRSVGKAERAGLLVGGLYRKLGWYERVRVHPAVKKLERLEEAHEGEKQGGDCAADSADSRDVDFDLHVLK